MPKSLSLQAGFRQRNTHENRYCLKGNFMKFLKIEQYYGIMGL